MLPLAVVLLAIVPVPQEPLLELHCAGPAAVLPDARDAGLRRALELAPARLAELDLTPVGLPPGLLSLLAPVAAGPFDLAVAAPSEGAPRFRLVAHGPDSEWADALADRLAGLPALAPWPVALERHDTDVVLRSPDAPPISSGASEGLPPGVRPALVFEVSTGLLSEEPAEAPAEAVLRLSYGGLFAGERLRFAIGHDGTGAHGRATAIGAARDAQGGALRPELDPDALRLVPEDATWFDLRWLDPGWVADLLEAPGPPLPAGIEGHFTGTFGLYASLAGGGGWLSAVAFAELGDPERTRGSLDELIEPVDAALDAMSEGWARLRAFERAGVPHAALTFPGLPVPFEPTAAVQGRWLFVGVTPQALEAALAQAADPATCVRDHPRLGAELPAGLEGVMVLQGVDTPALLGPGYGYASLAAGALANALRSRTDPAREPGLVLPPLGELAQGSRPAVHVTRVVGDDLVTESRWDRSWTADLTGQATYAAPAVLVAVGVTGVFLLRAVPWDGQPVRGGRFGGRPAGLSRQSTARSELLAIQDAMLVYYLHNRGAWPDDLEVLITDDEFGNRYLARDDLLDPWGRPYLFRPANGNDPPVAYTYGADGLPGGTGEDADRYSDEDRERSVSSSACTNARATGSCSATERTFTGGTWRKSAGIPSSVARTRAWR